MTKRPHLHVNELPTKSAKSDAQHEEWTMGFEDMGSDPESCDIEYAFVAQAEVVLGEIGPHSNSATE